MATLIKNAFSLEQLEIAFALGTQQINGAIADLTGHISSLEGISVERITSGWIIKSTTAVRTIYFLIVGSKIHKDILWHDGSADTETYTVDLTAKILLRTFSVLENTHK